MGRSAVTLAMVSSALVCFAVEEVPRPPDEKTVVLQLLDAMAAGGDVARIRAANQLGQHAEAAGPLLRTRLEDPELPHWVAAANSLARIAPHEVVRLEGRLSELDECLAVRYHLWQISRLKRPPWGYRSPFPSDRGDAGPHVKAIDALGCAAGPELVRSLGDAGLRNQAAYVVGALKLKCVARELAKHIVGTRVHVHPGQPCSPGHRYSLAAQALIEMGPDGHRVLLDYLSGILFTARPGSPRSQSRAAADIIVEAIQYGTGSLRTQLEEALVGLVNSEDRAVREWALSQVISMQGKRKGDRGEYGLDVPIDALMAMLDENASRPNTPSKLATIAAGYLTRCVQEPKALHACVAQFERGRFIDICVDTWSKCTWHWRWSRDPAAKALRDRMRKALRKELDECAVYWKMKPKALSLLANLYCYGDSSERAETYAVVRPVATRLLLDDPRESTRAAAIGVFTGAMRGGRRTQIFDVISRAIRNELARPELRNRTSQGTALQKMVQMIPCTDQCDPRPLFDEILRAEIQPKGPGMAVTERLASIGEISDAGTVLSPHAASFVGADTTIRFGFHILPTAVEQVNVGDPRSALIALQAVERIATCPEKKLKYRRFRDAVLPDRESKVLAGLATRHMKPGILRLLKEPESRKVNRFDVRRAVIALQVRDLIPLLIEKTVTDEEFASRCRESAYLLSHFELEDENYDRLFELAKNGDDLAFLAMSGTANPKAAQLHTQFLSRPSILAVCLLRIGDERGVDLCLAALRSGKRRGTMTRAVALLGQCKTPGAAQKMLDYINSPSVQRDCAYDALREMGRPAVPAILRALADTTWPINVRSDTTYIRRRLVEALGEIGDERAVPMLKWVSATRARDLRRAALLAIGAIGTEAAKQAILDEIDTSKLLDWGLLDGVIRLFRGDERAGELFTTIAEQSKHNSLRNTASLAAAEETRNPAETRDRLYAIGLRDPKSKPIRALVLLGDSRVAGEAFKKLTRDTPEPYFEAVARLDRAGLEAYALKVLEAGKKLEKKRAAGVLARLGLRRHERLFRQRLASDDAGKWSDAAGALACMNAPGISRELFRQLKTGRLGNLTVAKALGHNKTDEAADVLSEWYLDPALQDRLTETGRWRVLEAMRKNGRPKALAAYRGILYGYLTGSNIPRSRRALAKLAEVDREALGKKLVEMAASLQPYVRCVALYGFQKYFGYDGTYDPFESRERCVVAAKELSDLVR